MTARCEAVFLLDYSRSTQLRPPLQICCKHRTSQMLKLLLCTVFRSVVVFASILALPAIAVAQHSMNDHVAPSEGLSQAPRDQVLAQASPQTPPPQSAMPMMPGMGQGDMHAPHIITLRSGIAGGRMVYIGVGGEIDEDRKSTRLNSSHLGISYAVFCLKKK